MYLEPSMKDSEVISILSEVMTKIVQGGNSRVMWCGDFNAILNPTLDTAAGKTRRTRGKKLDGFLATHDLTDIWRMGHPTEK